MLGATGHAKAAERIPVPGGGAGGRAVTSPGATRALGDCWCPSGLRRGLHVAVTLLALYTGPRSWQHVHGTWRVFC